MLEKNKFCKNDPTSVINAVEAVRPCRDTEVAGSRRSTRQALHQEPPSFEEPMSKNQEAMSQFVFVLKMRIEQACLATHPLEIAVLIVLTSGHNQTPETTN